MLIAYKDIFEIIQADQVATRSKAPVCGRSLAGIAGSNPVWGMDVSLVSVVLSGGGLCFRPITRPEESYRVWCD